MTIDTSTEKGRHQRIGQIINEHARKSKRVGDHHFREAVEWGVPADHMDADAGEAPQGARWN